MSADKDIEAVLREFDGAPSSANAKAAARLILEARRERDMALARETDLENERAKLSELHDEDVQRLTAERDAALAEAQKWSEAHGRLCEQRDAALAELEKRTAERDVRETARQMAVRERDEAQILVQAWHRSSPEMHKALTETRAERDVAREEAAQWSQKAIAHASEVNAKLDSVEALARCAVAERDAALARVRELEDLVDHNRTRANVTFMAQVERIAQLEADLDNEVRRRDEFAREAAELDSHGGGVMRALACAGLLVALPGCFSLLPGYVWNAERQGEAEFVQAEQNRRIKVLEAQAALDSAKLYAAAEVERAKGVAEANKIIGASLHENEAYLRWLWIKGLEETGQKGHEVIYVPTEAGLPILEAGKRK